MARDDRSVDVLLVGGGAASVRAARTLRRHGFTGSIALVGSEDRPPYNRPPLSKELLAGHPADELIEIERATWYARRSIELRTGTPVVALDLDAHVATLGDGSLVTFERCLLASGAEARALPVAGADTAMRLHTLPDALRIRAAVAGADPGAEVVVVGGGLIGVEVASAMARSGLRPTVVELTDELWGGGLGRLLAGWATERLRSIGVTVRLRSRVTELTPGAAWIGAERLSSAFTVAGIGVVPNDALASASGLRVADGIVVDAAQRTSHPAVWAAGDVASVAGRRVEHWHAARESGERAALSMLEFPGPPIPPAWVFTEVAGATLDIIGDFDAWDREEWIVKDRLVAFRRSSEVVALASVDGSIGADTARRLLVDGASIDAAMAAVS